MDRPTSRFEGVLFNCLLGGHRCQAGLLAATIDGDEPDRPPPHLLDVIQHMACAPNIETASVVAVVMAQGQAAVAAQILHRYAGADGQITGDA